MPKITLPPYVTIEHPTELKGKVLILQTSPPYMIGQVWKFTSKNELDRFLYYNEAAIRFADYHMAVCYYGEMESHEYIQGEIGHVLIQMMKFYLEARIKNFPQGFTRYKV